MEPDLARQMFEFGGTLVLLGMPKGTEFGIDMQVFKVGDKFKGVKMIPPGLHFIYFSAVSNTGDVTPRSGFFHYFKEKELLVKKYLEPEEDIIPEENEEQIERIRSNLYNLDKNLGPYSLETYSKWISLVQHIQIQDLERLNPLSGKVNSVGDLVAPVKNDPVGPQSPSEISAANHKTVDDMVRREGTEVRFTKFPRRPYKDGATPQEITRYSIDSSYSIQTMFPTLESRPEIVLAELQLAFVTFLVGQVYEGFEQWKALISSLCKAEETLLNYPDLFMQLLSSLHFQINEVPQDLFVDITEDRNFLADALTNLFANIHDNATRLPPNLVLKSRRFKRHLYTKFAWSLSVEEEEGENAPVYVDC